MELFKVPSLFAMAIILWPIVLLIPVSNPQEPTACFWTGQPCTSPGYDGDEVITRCHISNSNLADRRCCVDSRIPQGAEPVMCARDDPSTTSWRNCREGYHQDYEKKSSAMQMCVPMSFCDQVYGLRYVSKGTRFSDVVCECDLEKNYWNWSNKTNPGSKDCRWHSCPAGTELKASGKCESCESGTYKFENHTGSCKPWTQCRKVLRYGTDKTDSECEPEDTVTEMTSISNMSSTVADQDDSRKSSSRFLLVIAAVTAIVCCCVCFFAWLYKKICTGPDKRGNSGDKKLHNGCSPDRATEASQRQSESRDPMENETML